MAPQQLSSGRAVNAVSRPARLPEVVRPVARHYDYFNRVPVGRNRMWYAVSAYLGLVAAASLVSFAVYGFDKRRAASGGRRVPERRLLLLAFLGGWPGSFAAQQWFRHKTRKVPFLTAFWVAVVLHVALVGVTAYKLFGGGADR